MFNARRGLLALLLLLLTTIFLQVSAVPPATCILGTTMYIDPTVILTDPQPPFLPSCSPGYTFAFVPNYAYSTAIFLASSCLGGGQQFWANGLEAENFQVLGLNNLGYVMMTAALGTFTATLTDPFDLPYLCATDPLPFFPTI